MTRLFYLFFSASVRDVSSSRVVCLNLVTEVHVLAFRVLFLGKNLMSQCVPSTRRIARAT